MVDVVGEGDGGEDGDKVGADFSNRTGVESTIVGAACTEEGAGARGGVLNTGVGATTGCGVNVATGCTVGVILGVDIGAETIGIGIEDTTGVDAGCIGMACPPAKAAKLVKLACAACKYAMCALDIAC